MDQRLKAKQTTLQIAKKFERLEEQVKKLQEEKTGLEQQLGDPAVYADKDKFLALDEQYKLCSTKFGQATKEHEAAFEKMMELEEKLG